jgi:multiple sugar transport system permease protein
MAHAGERTLKARIAPYLYVAPAAAVILTFNIIPILYAFYMSFFDWGIVKGAYVGFENYVALVHDPVFWQSLLNTIWFVLGVVPLGIAAALAVSVLLTRKIRGMGFYRTVYFLPVVTSLVAISMVFKWLYNPRIGLFNYLLGLVGINPLGWLNEPTGVFTMFFKGTLGIPWPDALAGPSLALVAIIFMSIWKGLGYNVVLFIAGLQNISQEYYEAARIDGASRARVFRHVTWPLLAPTTFYVLVMTTIVSFLVFTQVYVMTGPPIGGPLGTTRIIVYYLFEKGFDAGFNRGYASAIALVLFLIIMALTLVQKKFLESRIHYDA